MKTANIVRGSMNRKSNRGFTLIELMIVVVIVAILTTLAIPGYSSYVRKAQRKEAMAALQGLSQTMERYYAQNNSYKNAAVGPADTGSPRIFPQTAPLDGTAKYNLQITAATDTTYTLQAQPIAGGGQDKDGLLQLKSTGERAWDKDLNGSFSASELTWSDH